VCERERKRGGQCVKVCPGKARFEKRAGGQRDRERERGRKREREGKREREKKRGKERK